MASKAKPIVETESKTCPDCDGAGVVASGTRYTQPLNVCSTCDGNGTVPDEGEPEDDAS